MASTSLQTTIEETLSGPSNCDFIHALLDEKSHIRAFVELVLQDRRAVEGVLATPKAHDLVLGIYEKLSDSLQDAESQALTHALQDGYTLVGATLFDLACAFGSSCLGRLQRLLSSLWANAPWLSTEIEAAFDLFVEQLSAFQDKYALRTAQHQKSSHLWIEEALADLSWQLSAAHSWLSLIECCAPALSVLVRDNRSMAKLGQVYNAATNLLMDITRHNSHELDALAQQCKSQAKKLKWLWSGIANHICTALLQSLDGNTHSDIRDDQLATYKILIDLLDSMETTDTVLIPFENAPFLLDLEFRFGLRQLLKNAAAASDSFNESQMDYVVMSVDQLVDMADPLYRNGLASLQERINNAQAPVFATESVAGDEGTPGLSATHLASTSDSHDLDSISQIQELMPDLGEGFIRACLSYYNHNTESAVVAILEGNLPPTLAALDRTMDTAQYRESALADSVAGSYIDTDDKLSTDEDALSSRRNIFDNDEFDIFRRNTLDWSRVHRGKTDSPARLNDANDAVKSRVMQIAQRIEEEDEYDDTYDDTVQDSIGFDTPDADGFIAKDSSLGEDSSQAQADPSRAWEEVLVRQHISDPTVLDRKKESRKLPARLALREQTKLSDEQIEGWYIMFQRNPLKQQIVDKYELQNGQPALDTNTNPREAGSKPREKNKAKTGNHRRKQQHDRKMRNAIPRDSN
ncbi:hypothetical protein GGI12_002431 [Dipsacomyces acuminosporus]|nr:hypothetical protein GGI12_002431 [Dipsacomyces acuminosporus]